MRCLFLGLNVALVTSALCFCFFALRFLFFFGFVYFFRLIVTLRTSALFVLWFDSVSLLSSTLFVLWFWIDHVRYAINASAHDFH